MDITALKELIEAVDKSSLAYFEVKNNDVFIKMDKSLNRGHEILKEAPEVKAEVGSIEEVNTKAEEVATLVKEETAIVEDVKNGELVLSPMVGTFYISSSPEKPSFVNVGDKVKAGNVLCIIEAMKLMNEIESEWDGEIIEILVQNGDMVEYGMPLFKIKR